MKMLDLAQYDFHDRNLWNEKVSCKAWKDIMPITWAGNAIRATIKVGVENALRGS